jgi:hypothetical protein
VAHSPLAEEAELHVVPSPWPALIGLGVVVALSLATIGIDLVIDDHTAAETSDLVDNSLRSVTIADDLRNQVHRLARANLDRGSLSAVARHIADDARAYNPLATGEGEVEEWSRLQLLLDRLQREPTDANQRAQLLGQAEPRRGFRCDLVEEGRESLAGERVDGFLGERLAGLPVDPDILEDARERTLDLSDRRRAHLG